LTEIYRDADKHGVPNHKKSNWIHRKYKNIHVIRETSYGYGDSFPCVKCRATLERLDLHVTSHYQGVETKFRMIECEIKSKKTTGQILNRQPDKACVALRGHETRRSQQIHNCYM
jgi:hypothetical protein